MSFPQKVKQDALIKSKRFCCVCHDFIGRPAEVHHIVQESDGGSNDLDNAIVLCERCHGEAGHYNDKHPRGNKYSPQELKTRRDEWWKFCEDNPQALFAMINKGKAMKKPKAEKNEMTVIGNNNVQVGRDLVIKTQKTPTIKTLPPTNSIGANSILKETITAKFNRLGEERAKRFGKSAYAGMYSTFKRDFKIKKTDPYTIIWGWPQEWAPEIIDYLDKKYDNTMKGRIEKAATRPDHIAPRPQLYQMERKLLEHLGWDLKGTEIREFMMTNFGVSSHTQLSHHQHWQLVKSLEVKVKDFIGEE